MQPSLEDNNAVGGKIKGTGIPCDRMSICERHQVELEDNLFGGVADTLGYQA
jgi:hypothetical protein